MKNCPQIFDETICLTNDRQRRYYPGNAFSKTVEFIEKKAANGLIVKTEEREENFRSYLSYAWPSISDA